MGGLASWDFVAPKGIAMGVVDYGVGSRNFNMGSEEF